MLWEAWLLHLWAPSPSGRASYCRKVVMYQYLASVLTVPLPQVLPGNLLPDAVSWFFTSVLKGLQVHGQHDGCMAALVHLAFQIYEVLVRNSVLHPNVRLRIVRGMVKTNPMLSG